MKNIFLLFVFCLVLQGAVANNKDYVNVTYVQDTFVASFVHTTPLKDYVIGVSVSTLKVQEAFHNITLSHNEDWTDLCLDITLSNPLPELLKVLLPGSFMDLRVFYRVAPNNDISFPDIACPKSMIKCADGSWAGFVVVDGKCTLNCPSSPSGNLTHQQMLSIQNDFENEFILTYPYSEYVNGVEVTTLAHLNATHNITLNANEHWTDYCLSATLNSEPNSNISGVQLPTLYKGARVYYRVRGIMPWGHHSVSMISIVMPVALFILVLFLAIGCCMRRRRCKQACKARQEALLKATQEPVAVPQMVPADYALEMYPAPYGVQYDYQEQDFQGPVMMVPNGYPVYVPQQGWFYPLPQQE